MFIRGVGGVIGLSQLGSRSSILIGIKGKLIFIASKKKYSMVLLKGEFTNFDNVRLNDASR